MAEFELHPECKAMNDFNKTYGKEDIYEMPIEIVKERINATFTAFRGDVPPFDGQRTEIFIPSPDVKGGIPTYVYTPNSIKPDPVILVYFHGGSLILGKREQYHSVCQAISSSAGCIILNVEYRLAPEHKFPAMMDDAVVAVKWAKENKVNLGGADKSKVGIGGDSAGGTIAASVPHDVPLDFQILFYPLVMKVRDYSFPSMVKYANGPLLTKDWMIWTANHYLPPGEEENPRIASLLRPRFDHLPPTFMVLAEHDPVYDCCALYAKKLEDSGVPVEKHDYKGTIHGFFFAMAFCPTLNEDAINKVAAFIQKMHHP